MTIRIEGASEHNLKNIDIEIGDGLTVVTGVSGSGKTSLVFDTLYHEARRRFLDVFSLGAVAERLAPAAVGAVTGVGPAVAIEQNLLNRNPNSTLATASGLHPFLRLLYANYGQRTCTHCGSSLSVLSEDEVVDRLAALATEHPVDVYAPLVRGSLGSHATLLDVLHSQFEPTAIRVDGGRADGQTALNPETAHDLDLWLGKIDADGDVPAARALTTRAMALGVTSLLAETMTETITLAWSSVCVDCGHWFPDLTPSHFHRSCPACDGNGCQRCEETGLHPLALSVRWQGQSLLGLLQQSTADLADLFSITVLPPARLKNEIEQRLQALMEVGLGYVTLDRPMPSLSRGEAQRVRLAVALTSRLEEMLHVLDEPTIGLHPADVTRFLPALRSLPGPVIYVEHDRTAAAGADIAIDIGPGAGSLGGQVVFAGTPEQLWQAETPTGRYFSLRQTVALPEARPAPEQFLVIHGAERNNLTGFDVSIPLGRLTTVTGVSGSGKSTLVEEVLAASLQARSAVGCAALEGESLKAVMVDQSPIGRNPRSNPATYTKLVDAIRDHFAAETGFSPGHFSFNRKEGACPTCGGMGAVEVAMRFLPSTWIPCAACDGSRFSAEVLAATARVGQRRLNIAQVYELSVDEALSLFVEAQQNVDAKSRRAADRILTALADVGLGYLTLGQPSPTLSGGEAQRVKLAKFLGRRSLSRQLLLLDEPTTGLHPQDVSGLLTILDRVVRAGGTVVVVEHNLDLIRAADWLIDLGPGAGPEGGELLYAGPPDGIHAVERSLTAQALREEAQIVPGAGRDAKSCVSTTDNYIRIRGARVHNLKNIDVDFPKRALTVVTGVSGSGKSSLVGDVLEAEARRRFLETLSMYERQSTREGAEAQVDSITGLGVTVAVDSERRRSFDRRATVGTATDIAHHLAILLAWIGDRACLNCGTSMQRIAMATVETQDLETQDFASLPTGHIGWRCPQCDESASAEPRHFSSSTYGAACLTCNGIGTLSAPNPAKLIVHPDRPLCNGAMYSPGFFPKGYLCKPFNGGYDMVQALAKRYGFDPATTPWNEMSPEAQHAFLHGDPEPMTVIYQSRTRSSEREVRYPGFYGFIRDWDVGGTYTDALPCLDCGGARLRPEYLAVTVAGKNMYEMSTVTLAALVEIVREGRGTWGEEGQLGEMGAIVEASWRTVERRLRFLQQVGLGYLNLDRPTSTLSAGEAQRIKLAGLLGSELTSLTVLLDEPTRGLHPVEIGALTQALLELRDGGNTVIVVEHEPDVMRAADHLIDVGPGAGASGGKIVAQGRPESVMRGDSLTGQWLRGARGEGRAILNSPPAPRAPQGWLTVTGAIENNLKGDELRLPLGTLTGVCGVSGSGKSTLLLDTLGRALAPKKQTTSVAYEPMDPGVYERINGAPERAVLVDQNKSGLTNAALFLGLEAPLRRIYAASEDAAALGLGDKAFARGCSACKGRGVIVTELGFLPPVRTPCDVCRGSGYRAEVWQVQVNGVAYPDLFGLTIDQVYGLFGHESNLARPLTAARDVGLGYLMLRQPGHALSGGEAQRLKIAAELCRKPFRSNTAKSTLYILDEPTVGQHMADVDRLIGVLQRLVDAGGAGRNSVVVVEHHIQLLAACDWLVELGPGGGPDGGRIIAQGTPEMVAAGETPTAMPLRTFLAP